LCLRRRPTSPSFKFRAYPGAGANTLADMRTPYVVVVCDPGRRRGRFAVSRLIEKYGDASMPGLLPELTQCPKWNAELAATPYGI
jgi:hypothetical protein